MAATPNGKGYWLVALDGGVFSFGDANFYGSMGSIRLNQPVVGMAATPDGKGYWLVAADGGIFSFGDANFYGSMGGSHLNAPITGMAATPAATATGWWGRTGASSPSATPSSTGRWVAQPLNDPVVGMVATPGGLGYVMVATDGGVFTFGNAGFYGSLGGGYGGNPADVPPIAGIALSPGGQGYWLLEPDGWSYGFTNPPSAAPTAHRLGHRVHRQQPGEQRSRPGPVLQPVRAVRGVVLPVRHLGVGAGRRPHPAVPLHRQHLQLGRGQHGVSCRPRPSRCRVTPSSTAPRPTPPPPRCMWAWSCRCGRTGPS